MSATSAEKRLKDPDVEVVRSAIHLLRKKRRPQDLPLLLTPKLLRSPDSGIRYALVLALDAFGGRESIETLVELVSDEDWNVRTAAISALCSQMDAVVNKGGQEGADIFIRLLIVQNQEIRRKAVLCLSLIGSLNRETLLLHLASPSRRIRLSMVEFIGMTEQVDLAPMLLPLLEESDKELCCTTVATLGKLQNPHTLDGLIGKLNSADAEIVESALKALERMGGQACEALLKALYREKGKLFRRHVIRGLGEFKMESAIPELINNLGSSYYSVRLEAVNALIAIRKGVSDKLAELFLQNVILPDNMILGLRRSVSPRLRLHCIKAMGELRDPKAIPILVEVERMGLLPESDEAGKALEKIASSVWAKMGALHVLSEIGNEGDLPLVLKALSDDSDDVKLEALYTLDRLRIRTNCLIGKHLQTFLLGKLIEKRSDIRANIIQLLGHAPKITAPLLAALKKALKDKDYDVRGQACRALGRLGARPLSQDLLIALGDPSWSVRRDAEMALYNIGPENVPLLIKALGSRNDCVVIRAAKLLAAFKVKRVLPQLRKISTGRRSDVYLNQFLPGIIRTLQAL